MGNWIPTPSERARWDCVDEFPFDDSDHLQENSGVRIAEYIAMENAPSNYSVATITNVRIVIRLCRLMAFNNDFKEGLWCAWYNFGWGDWHKVNYISYTDNYCDFPLMPNGDPWTWAFINTTEIMMCSNVEQSYMMPRCSQQYIIVTYEIPSGQDLTFTFSETINPLDSSSMWKEQGFYLTETFSITKSLNIFKAKLFNTFETVVSSSSHHVEFEVVELEREEDEGGSGEGEITPPKYRVIALIAVIIVLIGGYFWISPESQRKRKTTRKPKPTVKPRKPVSTLKPRKQKSTTKPRKHKSTLEPRKHKKTTKPRKHKDNLKPRKKR